MNKIDLAVEKIVNAITNEGSHPEYHNRIIAEHSEQWPILWRALDDLVAAYRTKQHKTA